MLFRLDVPIAPSPNMEKLRIDKADSKVNIGRVFFAKKCMELQEPHLSAREIAVSRGLLTPAYINLPTVFGKRENPGMIRTSKGSGSPPS